MERNYRLEANEHITRMLSLMTAMGREEELDYIGDIREELGGLAEIVEAAFKDLDVLRNKTISSYVRKEKQND